LKERSSKLENKISFIFDWRVKLKKKINLVKGPENQKNKKKIMFWLKVEKNNNFYKRVKKKLKIKTI